MNYYKARQRKDGKWDFTCANDGVVHGVGYCCEYREIDPTKIPISESEQEAYRATAHKHHTDGHETAEEAAKCFLEYQLDHRLSLNRKTSNQQCRCHICKEWTQNYAMMDTQLWYLCPKHNTRKTVAGLVEPPQEIWSSW